MFNVGAAVCHTEVEVPEDSQQVETAVLVIGILVGFLGFVVGIIIIVMSKMELRAVWCLSTSALGNSDSLHKLCKSFVYSGFEH